jgi:flagellar hook-associated protein 2
MHMGISLTGISGTGFDWQSLIDQLTVAETAQKIDPLTTQKTKYQDKLTAWQSLGIKLSSLQTAMKNLKESDDFNVFNASLTSSSTTSADSLLSVTTGTGATAGRYEIIVDHVARSQKIQSSTVTSQTADTGWTGSLTLEGHAISLDGKSLQTLRDEINALNTGSTPSGVTATILQVADNDHRLILTHDATGAAGMNITDGSTGLNFSNTLQAGIDAAFSVDGISMTRSSNTITDAIAGLTLNLKGGDATTTVTMDVTEDNDAIEKKVQAFIDAYNDLSTYVNQQTSYDATNNKTGGVLFGDNTLKSIKNNLQSAFLNAGMFAAGITVDSSNKLSLDSDAFKTALADDFGGTVTLFNTMAQSMYDALDNVTDSIDGTVTLQENSLQANIDRMEDKITATQTLVDRKMALFTAQYTALDSALSEMKSQQEWLSSQLSSLSS